VCRQGADLLARLLADQRSLRVLVIIPGLLFLSVNQFTAFGSKFSPTTISFLPATDAILALEKRVDQIQLATTKPGVQKE
jgi:hypothetical protein